MNPSFPEPESRPVRVLFVCLGNICRSPAAEIIFNAVARSRGCTTLPGSDSCGTMGYHTGSKPDHRMLAALSRAGYQYGGHRARVFSRTDFDRFDLIVPQDESNRSDILRLARTEAHRAKVVPMSHWFPAGESNHEVPDPYYGGPEGFDEVVNLLTTAMENLVTELEERRLV